MEQIMKELLPTELQQMPLQHFSLKARICAGLICSGKRDGRKINTDNQFLPVSLHERESNREFAYHNKNESRERSVEAVQLSSFY